MENSINIANGNTNIVCNPFEQYLPTKLYKGLIEDIRDMYFADLCARLAYMPKDIYHIYPNLQLDRLRNIFMQHGISASKADYIISNLDIDKLVEWIDTITQGYLECDFQERVYGTHYVS